MNITKKMKKEGDTSGNLCGMEVFVDETLTEDKEIAFNAGTHTDLIRMAYNDFERLVSPKVVKVARH
ncbi:MAG TPA: hypothetical protein QF836_01880 [Nitrospinota bacterium]|nr:hypothetical protein [Nitrospinota bacterium]